MKEFKSSLVLGVFIVAAQLAPAQTVFNGYPSRIVGQHDLQQLSITEVAPNLVEGREFWIPEGIAVDTSVNPPILYVADALNNRVLAWKNASGFTKGDYADLVIGQRDKYSTSANGPGTSLTTGLSQPSNVIVDSKGNLYVADSANNRILRYPAPFQQTGALFSIDLIIGQQDQTGRNPNQNLPVPNASTLSLAGQFVGMAFDQSGNLYVGDVNNNRILRFPVASLASGAANGPNADLVLGQVDFATTTIPANLTLITKTSIKNPGALTFSPEGQLFVPDALNRVLVFSPPFTSGEPAARIMGVVIANTSPPLGPTNFGATASNPVAGPPNSVFFIGDNPYVIDTGNHRILEFPPFAQWPAESSTVYSPTATSVFGQPDFISFQPNAGHPQPSDNTFWSPAVAVVVGSDVIISDTQNNRVLAFPQQNGLFLHATRLLGQLDFPYNSPNLIEGKEFNFTAAQPLGPGVAVDNVSSTPHLYVADTYNNRILGFKDIRNVQANQVADLVIGQPDFKTGIQNYPSNKPLILNSSSLRLPHGLAVDSNGDLWVADSGNGRVLRFPKPFDQSNTQLEQANLVIGQTSFTTSVTDPSSQTMAAPIGIAFSVDGHLLVSDYLLNRILFFRKPTGGDFSNGQPADNVFGQPDFISATARELSGPRAIAIDSTDRLYVADTGNNRIAVYRSVPTAGNDPGVTLSLTGLNQPYGVAVDHVTGEIWVADTGNSRVVRFPEYDIVSVSNTSNLSFVDPGQPLSIGLDVSGNPVIAEAVNRVGLYYRSIGTSGNAGNYFYRFAPGMLAAIKPSRNSSFGSQTVQATTNPVPFQLGDVEVLVNGVPAPLLYVSSGQINLQIPQATPVGSNPVEFQVIQVSTNQVLAANLYRIDPYSPGLFTHDATGVGQLAAVNQDGTINSGTNPAKAGSVISLFGTGQGVVPGAPADGIVVPVGSLFKTPLTPRVVINSHEVTSDVSFSGLAPGAIGEWQINVKIPSDALGDVPVGISMDDFLSNQNPSSGGYITVTIRVAQ